MFRSYFIGVDGMSNSNPPQPLSQGRADGRIRVPGSGSMEVSDEPANLRRAYRDGRWRRGDEISPGRRENAGFRISGKFDKFG
ncbi:MAG: hypothetical protein OXG62_14580 [Nitrospinae bacterium]|nr:hypothetical protein [Nitrospinota bacterium]